MKWPTKKLGEVAILNPKKSEVYGLPDDLLVSFVSMSAVDEITQTIKTHEFRKLSDVRKGYTYFKEGDILFAKITPCMENGKVAIVKNLKNGIGFGSTEFHIIRPGSEILSKWIFYIVCNPAFREEAKKHMTGTAGQQRVPIGFLENIEIPLPPLSEQKRIVAKIEKLFAKIDEAERLRKESLAASAALLPSALHQVFSRAKKEKWTTKKLGEVLKLIESGSRPKGGVRHIFEGFPSIGAEHLTNNGDFNFERMKYIPRNFFKKLNRGIIQCGDILIVKDGATTGKVSLVTKNFPFEEAAVNEHVFILRSNSEIISEFLFYFLFSEKGKKQILQTFHGMTQGGINSDFVNFVEIPLPPLSEQKRIVAYLDSLSEKARALQKLQQEAASDFSTLRQSILAQVFN